MRSLLLITAAVSTLISFHSAATNVTVRWTGKVPTSDCITKPVSNAQDLSRLRAKCPNEYQEVTNGLKNEKQKAVVSFNI